LAKIHSDGESFICALMPGSYSLQIKKTPGIYLVIGQSNTTYIT